MTHLTRASDGHSFTFGQTTLYVGPGPRGSRGPVLAFVRPGAKKPTIVATFNSSSTAEKLVDVLRTAVDELTPQAAPAASDEPESPDEAAILAAEHPGDCSDCGHRSDCALHNRPALAVKTCSCKGPSLAQPAPASETEEARP